MVPALGAALLIVGLRLLAPGDARAIRRRFDALARIVRKAGVENAFTIARKSEQLGDLLADECVFQVTPAFFSDRYSRREAVAQAVRVRSAFDTISLEFHDLDIGLGAARTSAVCRLTARLEGKLKAGDRVNEVREIECELAKQEGSWQLRGVREIAVLEK